MHSISLSLSLLPGPPTREPRTMQQHEPPKNAFGQYCAHLLYDLDLDHILRLCYTASDMMPSCLGSSCHRRQVYTLDLMQLEFVHAPKQSRKHFLGTERFWYALWMDVFAKLPSMHALFLDFMPHAEPTIKLKLQQYVAVPMHERFRIALDRFYRHILQLESRLPPWPYSAYAVLSALADIHTKSKPPTSFDSLSYHEITLLLSDLIAFISAITRHDLLV